jgi:hypothetical protein
MLDIFLFRVLNRVAFEKVKKKKMKRWEIGFKLYICATTNTRYVAPKKKSSDRLIK